MCARAGHAPTPAPTAQRAAARSQETSVKTEVDVALRELVKIHNLRLKIGRLTSAAEGLAQHGPMKPPEQQGLDDDTPLLEDYDVKSGQTAPRKPPARSTNFNQDPTERRTGNAPPDDIAAVITRTVDDAKALVSERQVQMKVPATVKALEDAINNIKGSVMIAFPMGLPDYDTVRQILEEREQLDGGASSLEVLEPEASSLWFANKEMQREKVLMDYVGKNEKTKVRRPPPRLARSGACSELWHLPRRWWRNCRRRSAQRCVNPLSFKFRRFRSGNEGLADIYDARLVMLRKAFCVLLSAELTSILSADLALFNRGGRADNVFLTF